MFDLILPIAISMIIYQALKKYLETTLKGKGLVIPIGYDIGLRIGMIYIIVWMFHFILGYWYLAANIVYVLIIMIVILMKRPFKGA